MEADVVNRYSFVWKKSINEYEVTYINLQNYEKSSIPPEGMFEVLIEV